MVLSVDSTELLESVIETELEELEDLGTDSGIDTNITYSEVVTSSYDEQILFELKVSNSLMGIQIAIDVLFLALFFLVFFMTIIRNNITNLFT